MSDCWSMARTIWREQFNIDVNPIGIDPSDMRAAMSTLTNPHNRKGWAVVEQPREGDAVLMGRNARPCHVGIWAAPDDQAAIIHSIERSGVILSRPAQLATLGYRLLGGYRREP